MILCVGTTPALQRTMFFDRLTPDQVNRAKLVVTTAAGKSINVLRVAHRLGACGQGMGFLGGQTGQMLRVALRGEQLTAEWVEVPFQTRICTTLIDRSNSAITELVEESRPVPEACWQALESAVTRAIPRAKVLVLSGGLPPEGPQDFYARCCTLANDAGIPVIVDAQGEPLQQAMSHRPMLVKPNRAELEATFGLKTTSDAQLKEAIRRLHGLGARSALITLGAHGAVFSDGEAFWMLRAPTVKVVNPIGSGDSVTAGIAVGLTRGHSLLDACVLGIACGSANAMTETPGVVREEDVGELRPKVVVEPF